MSLTGPVRDPESVREAIGENRALAVEKADATDYNFEPSQSDLDLDARLLASLYWRDPSAPLTFMMRTAGAYVYGVLPAWDGRYYAGVRIRKEDVPTDRTVLPSSQEFETVITTYLEEDAIRLTYEALKESP